ncbi:MAG TPA: hypothetical protein DCP97_00665 [Ruminococcaceae bacterium]|nr:hypothetical protein [Oscillospiraceae bacterium]
MVLVVGGFASGKLEYVKKILNYSDNQISHAQIDSKPVLNNLHLLVKNAGIDAIDLNWLLSKEVVICDEIGCGIVPASAGERKWREDTGRLCILLAQNANKVVRLQCGIASVIKSQQ